MIRAVIFDMDGVVANTTQQDRAAWTRIFAENGISLTREMYLGLLGMRGQEI
jgi:beta-phosphoglucomutase-like phosphatase (HAD superfamily)